MTPQQDFLRSEFRTLSFMGASQHVAIYAESANEDARRAFRVGLYVKLESFAQPYEQVEISEGEHIANIQRFADELSTEFTSTLKDGRLLIGPTQKTLNLYLKYLWCAGWSHRPPHCPVDAIVLCEAGHGGIRWSKMESIDAYRDAIAILREAAGGTPLAEWELEAWRRGKAGTAKGAPQNAPCRPRHTPEPARQAKPLRSSMLAALLCASMLFAATTPGTASAQANGKYEHMEYGIGTAQRLAAAREALRDDTFPELNVPTNVENFIAIDMACEKYPRSAVRQTCVDAGKVRHHDSHRSARAAAATAPQRSIADQAREVQAATAAREAITVDKEARKEHVRALKAQLSGWDEHNAYDRCMKERDHSEASNPLPRDLRDRRPAEPAIPPADIVEACVAASKQHVAAEKQHKAEAAAASEQRYQAEHAKLAACEKSAAAQMARSANAIVMYRGLIDIAKQQLERDKQVEKVSGVVDLKARSDAGEVMVDGANLIEQEFADYRAAGGTARSAEDVKSMPNPCKTTP